MSAPTNNKNASKPDSERRDSMLYVRLTSEEKGRLKANAYPRKVGLVVRELLEKAGLFEEK